jgi:hypothetical protein
MNGAHDALNCDALKTLTLIALRLCLWGFRGLQAAACPSQHQCLKRTVVRPKGRPKERALGGMGRFARQLASSVATALSLPLPAGLADPGFRSECKLAVRSSTEHHICASCHGCLCFHNVTTHAWQASG